MDPGTTVTVRVTEPFGAPRGDGAGPVRRYLLDSERLVFAVRRHAVVLVVPTLLTVAIVVPAAVVARAAPRGSVLQGVAAAVLLVAVGWWGWRVVDWGLERFVVTDRRVLLVSGVLSRRVAIMPLRKVTDLTYERSVAGRLLGYGAFVMESAGQHQALSRIDALPTPGRLYRLVSDLLFGGDEAAARAVHDPDDEVFPPGRSATPPDRPPGAPYGRPPAARPPTGGPGGPTVGTETAPLPRLPDDRPSS